MDSVFYKNTLLPSLFRAKKAGINIKNKSALLHYFAGATCEPEHLWVCCASGDDLEQTASLVERMRTEKTNVLGSFQITATEADKLNALLWKSNLKVIEPKKATEEDVRDLAERAFEYLMKQDPKAGELPVMDAVLDFIDQVYLSDVDFKYHVEPKKIFAAKHLYYKNAGDELDDLEIDSEVTEEQIQLGMREFKKHLV